MTRHGAAAAPPRARPTMRAARYGRYGSPEVLELETVPAPAPRASEVLVRVHAAGLNPKDALVRGGALRPLSGRAFPRGTGFDFAGHVAALGAAVPDLAPGRRVWGFLDGYLGGAAADYVAVPRGWLAEMPERLGWLEGAAIPLVASAALQGLRDGGRLAAGERLLIKGASGGVGSAAIQIAKALGAHVTALASGAGLEHCRALGADAVVESRSGDPLAELAAIAARDGRFDVFLDCVGGSGYRVHRRLLARGGRWVSTAPAPWMYAAAPLARAPRIACVIVRPVRADLEEIGRLVERGLFRMPVTRAYPLEAIRMAHGAVAERHGRGKSVVVVSPQAVREAAAHPETAVRARP
jgi:NADPH:quinone reductase-like Zn-dependent oxidoreductase